MNRLCGSGFQAVINGAHVCNVLAHLFCLIVRTNELLVDGGLCTTFQCIHIKKSVKTKKL